MSRSFPRIRADFLVLMLTERCNLSCAYCYARAGESGTDLDPDLALRAVRACSPGFIGKGSGGNGSGPGRLTVELTGGEPLLVFDRLKVVVEQTQRLEQKPRLAIQTNGLLLDRGKLDYLLQNRVGLGLSLDGLPRINDLTRGRSGPTLEALDLLDESGAGVNLTVVLTRGNLEHLPEFLLFCAARPSVRVINLDLVRDLGRAGDRGLSPEPKQIREVVPRLVETLTFINSRRIPPLKIREVDQIRRREKEKAVQPYCLAAMGAAVAVDPEGRLWPCASLAGQEELAAGTVDRPDRARLSGEARLWSPPPECRDCPTVKICRGGCPSRRLAETGRPDRKSSSECGLRRGLHQCLAHGGLDYGG